MASCILRGKYFFKNQIPKKVLRGAKSPLNICKKNTQNTFLKHLQCERSWAIFVIHIKTYIMILIYDTNIQIKNIIENKPPKNKKLIWRWNNLLYRPSNAPLFKYKINFNIAMIQSCVFSYLEYQYISVIFTRSLFK